MGIILWTNMDEGEAGVLCIPGCESCKSCIKCQGCLGCWGCRGYEVGN